MSITVFTGTAT